MENERNRNDGYHDRASGDEQYRGDSLLARIKRDLSAWFESHRDNEAESATGDGQDQDGELAAGGNYGHGRYDMDDARLHFHGHMGTPDDERYQHTDRYMPGRVGTARRERGRQPGRSATPKAGGKPHNPAAPDAGKGKP